MSNLVSIAIPEPKAFHSSAESIATKAITSRHGGANV